MPHIIVPQPELYFSDIDRKLKLTEIDTGCLRLYKFRLKYRLRNIAFQVRTIESIYQQKNSYQNRYEF